MSNAALAERILKFIEAKGYQPRQLEDLARAMGLGADEQGDFHAACKALMKTGRIVLGARNALVLAEPPLRMVGTFRGNARGFGFVVPETPCAQGDLYIPSGATGGAITGDTVAARVQKRGKRDGKMLYEGRVTAIVRRGQSRFVGELQRQFRRWFVIPDGNVLHVPIGVDDPGAKNAAPGDQVVVEIIQYPTAQQEARGVLVKVLGPRGEPGVDTLSIIEQYQLPGDFPEEVLREAHAAAESYDPRRDAGTREDLTGQTIITIDPVDARDFDDAISLTPKDDGTIELGVHIADVSHFVRAGSALDREARVRSNSIYLPRTVIPMLPEVLSNGVCSLQERQPRLTKSAFITYDRKGAVRKARFANTVIRSAKRLTYEQAGAILDGKRGRFPAKVMALIKAMDALARTIRARRLREGMLVLELPEVDLVHGDDGRVIDVKPADTGFSHTIIEMFMVEANEALARLFVEHNVPALRRVHDEPSETTGGNLRRLLRVLGYELPKVIDRGALQRLLDEVRGKPESFAVNLAVLRSMAQAEYSPLRIGHYALASKHYCHFTSPIRRYPDLTIHRLMDAYLAGEFATPAKKKALPSEEDLAELGNLCSANERRAEAAERELTLVLVLRLLEGHVGDTFDGVVTGVANMGVFVQLQRFLVDGLVRFSDISDDWWEVDPSRGAVVGQRSGQRITVGDRLAVTISRIDLPTRQLELMLAGGSKGRRRRPEKVPNARHSRRARRQGGRPGDERQSSDTSEVVRRRGRRTGGGKKGRRANRR